MRSDLAENHVFPIEVHHLLGANEELADTSTAGVTVFDSGSDRVRGRIPLPRFEVDSRGTTSEGRAGTAERGDLETES